MVTSQSCTHTYTQGGVHTLPNSALGISVLLMLGGWSLKEFDEKEFNPRRVMMLCAGSKSQNTDYAYTSRKLGHPVRKRLWRVGSSGRGQHKYQIQMFAHSLARCRDCLCLSSILLLEVKCRISSVPKEAASTWGPPSAPPKCFNFYLLTYDTV